MSTRVHPEEGKGEKEAEEAEEEEEEEVVVEEEDEEEVVEEDCSICCLVLEDGERGAAHAAVAMLACAHRFHSSCLQVCSSR